MFPKWNQPISKSVNLFTNFSYIYCWTQLENLYGFGLGKSRLKAPVGHWLMVCGYGTQRFI